MGKKIKKHYCSVQSSSSNPYSVELTLDPLAISCTCTAAYTNIPCKHRIAILSGNDPGFVEPPEDYLEILQQAKQEAEAIGVFEVLETYGEVRISPASAVTYIWALGSLIVVQQYRFQNGGCRAYLVPSLSQLPPSVFSIFKAMGGVVK